MDTTTSNSQNSSVVPGLDLLNRRRDSLSNVSPLEQEVLDEYERLAGNMERVSRAMMLDLLVLFSPLLSLVAEHGGFGFSTLLVSILLGRKPNAGPMSLCLRSGVAAFQCDGFTLSATGGCPLPRKDFLRWFIDILVLVPLRRVLLS